MLPAYEVMWLIHHLHHGSHALCELAACSFEGFQCHCNYDDRYLPLLISPLITLAPTSQDFSYQSVLSHINIYRVVKA